MDAVRAQSTTLVDAIDWRARLAALTKKHKVPGAAFGILRQGRLTDVAAGVLSKATGVPATTESVFQIGSITKVWTATLVMQLVDDGALSLDTPVARIVPEFSVADPVATKTITVRHLITHTSGIDGDLFTDTGRGDDCLARFVAELPNTAQTHPVAATFSYCNSGFTIAGRIVEVLTGMTWDAALHERIIEPLGLTATMTLPEEALLHTAAVGHVGDPETGQVPTPTWALPRSTGPAGLITARVRDVLAFARSHLNNGTAPDGTRVLSAAATRTMMERQVDVPDTSSGGIDSWGVGWARYRWNGHRVIGHDGGTLGQYAFLRLLPEQNLAIALLTNGGDAQALSEDLFTESFGQLAAITPPAPFTPPDHPVHVDPRPYVGRYSRAGLDTEIREHEGTLILRSTGTGSLAAIRPWKKEQEQPLIPVAEDLFAMRKEGTTSWESVFFYPLADGSQYFHQGLRANPRT